MPFKAKFIGGLKLDPEEKEITLTMIISMDNVNQRGEGLEAFIDLVNRHPRINRLRVIVSAYLHRHYVGEEQALALGKEWIKNNQPILEQAKVQVDLEELHNLLENRKNDFELNIASVNKLYNDDADYKSIVTGIALQHMVKCSLDAAKNYLLDECAVSLLIDEPEAYPAAGLNKALQYVRNIHKPTKSYYGYRLSQVHEIFSAKNKLLKASPDETLANACFSFTETLQKHGIFYPTDQVAFFKEFLNLKSKYEAKAKYNICEEFPVISQSQDDRNRVLN